MGVTNEGDLLFQCECNEPEGLVTRSVYRVDFTPENLDAIYQKAKQFKTLMGWEIPTYEHFICLFMRPIGHGFESNGLCARIDNWCGIFWLSDINLNKLPYDASIHYTFFDKRHKGRLDLCRTAIQWVFDKYGFQRLWTQSPLFNDKTLTFMECIGFRKEGRLKEKMIYQNTLFDANLYALTIDEVKSGDAFIRGDKIIKRIEERKRGNR